MSRNRSWGPLLAAAAIVALPAWSATTSAIIATPAEPQVVIVQTAPPPLRTELVPAPREGYVWAPGYWSWDGTGYTWVDGRMVPEQPGVVYVAPRWEAANGGYAFHGERWARDPSKPNPLGNATANPLQPSSGQ